MGRPEKPVDTSSGAAAFACELRRLRARAGNPTYRDMGKVALYSASVLSSAASGHRMPTLQVTLAFVAACGGDREEWRRRWLEVSSGLRPDTTPARADQARSCVPRPAQLPMRPRGFAGRDDELHWLAADTTTPVVVGGPAGVGKSALAGCHAHRLAVDAVDGQLYADLGPREPGEEGARAVIDGFLRALGVPAEHLPAAPDQQAGLYRSLLVERALVVLLDNVRDERQVRSLLVESPRSTTVIVSRTPLLGLHDVRRLALDVPTRADAIALLAGALPERVAAEPDALDRLARLCGDLPLALAIAARKLAARPDVPVDRVLPRLADPVALLEWLRVGDLSVHEVYQSTYLGLGAPARAVLHRLAERPPGEPVACGAGGDDEPLHELAEAGVLRRTGRPGVHRLDPLARAFALARRPVRPAAHHELIAGSERHYRSTVLST
ncbi:helix-turn-helix domain-containing protein [Saccharothrix obliqua]|uniref:helix-turn-helix domain-containing protein n=1 Tax=Saccharothrix obliqua TaxID=2861747 RepID=UPI001C5E979B|nr:helix-turn-helix domain-containing protein [Saccharothrix obliqua]MBW4718028.1 NB-ARC domain-containing protein [Saccharothrix obliqua]